MIEIPDLDPLTRATLERVIHLASLQPEDWTLVGAQMVKLHGWERGMEYSRGTTDADVLVNARAVQDATERFSSLLLEQDFDLDGISPDGIGHRFTDGTVKIDVLAPEGLGMRKSRLTTVPPARTVSVPGGTQALFRSDLVQVKLGEIVGRIPRPNLLGAILVKTRAVDVDDVPKAQLGDLAFLLSMIEDPRALSEQLKGREHLWLRRRKELHDRDAPIWRAMPDKQADDGHLALHILARL